MLQRINKHQLVPVVTGKEDKRPIRGADLIPHLYCNCYDLGRKKSGKTLACTYICKKCALPGFTTVIVYSATASTDATWQATFAEFDKVGIAWVHFTSLINEETKEHHLHEWFRIFERTHDEEGDPEPVRRRVAGSAIAAEKPEKPKKFKERAPETIFVFDDFSLELKDKWVSKLLKEHRHYFCKVIVSSQFLTDLRGLGPRGQIDIWLLFGRIDEDLIQQIAKTVGIRYPLLQKLYDFATKKPFHFLYLDWAEKDIRVNFDQQINKKLLKVE